MRRLVWKKHQRQGRPVWCTCLPGGRAAEITYGRDWSYFNVDVTNRNGGVERRYAPDLIMAKRTAVAMAKEQTGDEGSKRGLGGLSGAGDPPDYDWWRQNGRAWRAKITRALSLVKTNPRKALQMADELTTAMDEHGYPDEWVRVQRLREDAQLALRL